MTIDRREVLGASVLASAFIGNGGAAFTAASASSTFSLKPSSIKKVWAIPLTHHGLAIEYEYDTALLPGLMPHIGVSAHYPDGAPLPGRTRTVTPAAIRMLREKERAGEVHITLGQPMESGVYLHRLTHGPELVHAHFKKTEAENRIYSFAYECLEKILAGEPLRGRLRWHHLGGGEYRFVVLDLPEKERAEAAERLALEYPTVSLVRSL